MTYRLIANSPKPKTIKGLESFRLRVLKGIGYMINEHMANRPIAKSHKPKAPKTKWRRLISLPLGI
jgi:hypothetical protein